MRSFGKGRVLSTERMKKKEQSERDWKLLTLYTTAVAGIVSYFSLILVFLSIIIRNEMVIDVIAVIMAVIVMVLLIMTKKYHVIDRIRNKRLLANVLDSFGLFGIFGFVIEKILNLFFYIAETKGLNIENSDLIELVIMVILLLLAPLGVFIDTILRPEWKMVEE